ncbi:MAG: hypothetical protein JWO80_2242 [Bryobacterales bacterium]|nr:hypothetical protein [Bryobacterales bacterium]
MENILAGDVTGTPDPGAIAPLSWDMTGKTPFSNSRMYLRTDALGHISDWHLDTSFADIGGGYSGCQTSGPGQFDECVSVSNGNLDNYEHGPNGIWTSDAVTPEPYLLLPLGLGFVALCLTRSRS